MGKDSPQTPQAPDPFATAAAQGALNQSSMATLLSQNRTNSVNPWSTTTWTQGPPKVGATAAPRPATPGAIQTPAPPTPNPTNSGDQFSGGANDTTSTVNNSAGGGAYDPNDPSGYRARALAAVGGGDPNLSGDWTQTTTLNPEDQARLDKQRALMGQQLNIGGTLLDRAQQNLSTPLQLQTGVNAGSLQTNVAQPGQIQNRISSQGVPGVVGGNQLYGDLSNTQNALYNQTTSRLDPRWNQQQHDLVNSLAAQGITAASNPAAFNREMDNFNRAKNDAYQTATNNAIAGGGAEQSRLANLGLATNQQMFGQNAAQLAANNAAANQGFTQNLAAGQFANQAQNQKFGQDVTNANLFNSSAQTMYNSPLNTLAALMSGSAVAQPQTQAAYMGTMGTPDFGNYANQKYQGDLNSYNSQVGQQNGMMGGLFSLGGSLLGGPAGGAGATLLGKLFGG